MAPSKNIAAAAARPVKIVLGIVLTMFAGIVVWQAWECVRGLELQKNGVPTQASVVRIFTSACGKRGCNLDVEYSYTTDPVPGMPGTSHKGYASIGNTSRPDATNLIYARTHNMIPIAYDRAQPDVSALNFNDPVLKGHPVRLALMLIGILGGMLGLLGAIMCLSFVLALYKARRPAP